MLEFRKQRRLVKHPFQRLVVCSYVSAEKLPTNLITDNRLRSTTPEIYWLEHRFGGGQKSLSSWHCVTDHACLFLVIDNLLFILVWHSFKSEVFSALMTLGPMIKYQNFLRETWRIPWGILIIPLQLLALPAGGRLIPHAIDSDLSVNLQAYVHMCTFCPTGGLQTSLNRYLPFPLEHNTGCYWHRASQYAMHWAWIGSPEWMKDEKIIESNEWKCGRNVGICAGVRHWLSTVLTLAMLFRGFGWSEGMVGLELRLDFSFKQRIQKILEQW